MADKDAFDRIISQRSDEVDNLPQATREEILWNYMRGRLHQSPDENSDLNDRALADLVQYLHIGGVSPLVRNPEFDTLTEDDQMALYGDYQDRQKTISGDLGEFIKSAILPNLNPDDSPRFFGSFESADRRKPDEPLRADVMIKQAKDQVRLNRLNAGAPANEDQANFYKKFYGE